MLEGCGNGKAKVLALSNSNQSKRSDWVRWSTSRGPFTMFEDPSNVGSLQCSRILTMFELTMYSLTMFEDPSLFEVAQ